MDDFPGAEFYDYYTIVTTICTWPGCGWKQTVNWSENMHAPFVTHFIEAHQRDE